jgi:hypothetical protein
LLSIKLATFWSTLPDSLSISLSDGGFMDWKSGSESTKCCLVKDREHNQSSICFVRSLSQWRDSTSFLMFMEYPIISQSSFLLTRLPSKNSVKNPDSLASLGWLNRRLFLEREPQCFDSFYETFQGNF